MPDESNSKAMEEKLRVLLEWFETNKVTYNEEALQIVGKQQGGDTSIVDGFGIVARRNLVQDEPLVVIPKSAAISSSTSAISNLFHDEELGGSLALSIAVMYEMSLGETSPWHGYLQSLPPRADIPLHWDKEARGWLGGTDVGCWIERDMDNLTSDFQELKHLVAKYPFIFVNSNGVDWHDIGCFLDVASLVSSRAFMVDVHRGNSMVPFADIFNHKTAAENVHIESEEMVCPLCGEAFGCEHMDALEAMEGNEEEEEEEDVEVEGGIGQDEEDDDEEWDSDNEYSEDEEDDEEEAGEELPPLVDENGISIDVNNSMDDDDGDKEDEVDSEEEDEEDKWIDTLDMVVYKPCKAGAEVFNTYGEHGSAYLLHRYGFCDRKSPFESVTLDTQHVLQAFVVAVSKKRSQDVARLMEDFSGMFSTRHRAKGKEDDQGSEDEGDIPMMEHEDGEENGSVIFSIDAPGHPSLNLATLLVLGLADEEAFSQVSGSEEIFGHYFPIIHQFWSVFQDRIDAGAPISIAFNDANKASDGAVKKSTVAMVCQAVYMLTEKRLGQIVDESMLQQPKPNKDNGCLALSRWEAAKQLRANERRTLKLCVRTYKKIAAKL